MIGGRVKLFLRQSFVKGAPFLAKRPLTRNPYDLSNTPTGHSSSPSRGSLRTRSSNAYRAAPKAPAI